MCNIFSYYIKLYQSLEYKVLATKNLTNHVMDAGKYQNRDQNPETGV